MKRLKSLLLINWHYIVHEHIVFEPITFLTGKNGAGKSTIIDALQMVILGDTSGYYFNKAANDNSRRTLKGYLRGEVAEAEESGVVYLRDGAFSSYIVAEYEDTVKKKSFCLGVVFDCQSDGSHEHRFFCLDDELPAFHFIKNGVPLDIHGLRQWGGQHKRTKLELFETNKRYQEVFRSKMGNLGEKFFRLFKKAVPFSPIMDVAGFISEFVCDVEHRLDIEDMRENIRHYRRLESELAYVERKVASLEQIRNAFQQVKTAEDRLQIYRYLLDRASLEAASERLAQIDAEIQKCDGRSEELGYALSRAEEHLSLLRQKRDCLIEERTQSDVFVRQQNLKHRKQMLESRFANLRTYGERQSRILGEMKSRWSAVHAQLSPMLAWEAPAESVGQVSSEASARATSDDKGIHSALPHLVDAYNAVHRALFDIPSLPEWYRSGLLDIDPDVTRVDVEAVTAAGHAITSASEALREAARALQAQTEGWKSEVAELDITIANLKRGMKRYDDKVLRLQKAIRDALSHQTGTDVEVVIFADAIDLRRDTWQKAIEGYLHTQRFYLIVAPEHFESALRVYDKVKSELRIFDVGLVDIGRILEQPIEVHENSLAKEIETDNPYARAYADFLLGRVIKCDTVDELRNFRTAITADGMLYQNFVARQIDPKRWETLYIGKRAVEQQLAQAEARRTALQGLLAVWEPRAAQVTRLSRTSPMTEDQVADVREAQGVLTALPDIIREYREVTDEIQNLDLSFLLGLEEKIRAVEAEIREREMELRAILRDQSTIEQRRRFLTETEQPQAEAEKRDAQATLDATYDAAFVSEQGEPRFAQELARLGSATAIQTNFGRQKQVEQNRRDAAWQTLVGLRADFNRDFQAGFDIQRPDNLPYDEELQRLIDSQLTAYREKIHEAKERAQIQFQEDFVSKLRSNIETVERQIRELNAALRGVTFGRDSYRFQVSPNPQYERFYRMLMDDMLLEGYGLFSQSFQERHGDVIEELFRNIVDVDDSDGVHTELEKNLQKFTDYRTYLNFDLIVKDEEGRESRLSRVIAKKSGGETQTPFYISVLASFAQLYRVRQLGSDNTLRLIVFDEAYSKMDHQRIRESIRLIREMGLQVIVSAPTEKLADISPLVDRTLIVTRIKSQTRVLPFDTRKDEVAVTRARY